MVGGWVGVWVAVWVEVWVAVNVVVVVGVWVFVGVWVGVTATQDKGYLVDVGLVAQYRVTSNDVASPEVLVIVYGQL